MRQLLDKRASASACLVEGRLGRNHNISEDLGVEVRKGPLAHREGQDVCWPIHPAIAGVELVDARVIDHAHAQVTGLTGEGRE